MQPIVQGRKRGGWSIRSMPCGQSFLKTDDVCSMFDEHFIPQTLHLIKVSVFLSSGENLPTSFYFHMKIIRGPREVERRVFSMLSLFFDPVYSDSHMPSSPLSELQLCRCHLSAHNLFWWVIEKKHLLLTGRIQQIIDEETN